MIELIRLVWTWGHSLTDYPSVWLWSVGASLHTADSKYFWFHHTEADTMTVQNPAEMNLCSALWAVVAYVVADMDEMLPR